MIKAEFLKGGCCKNCNHEIWLFKGRPWEHGDGDLTACSNPEPKPKERRIRREVPYIPPLRGDQHMTTREAPKPRPVRQRGADPLWRALARAVYWAIGMGVITWLVWGIGVIAGRLG
jgi:hypothetical protein